MNWQTLFHALNLKTTAIPKCDHFPLKKVSSHVHFYLFLIIYMMKLRIIHQLPNVVRRKLRNSFSMLYVCSPCYVHSPDKNFFIFFRCKLIKGSQHLLPSILLPIQGEATIPCSCESELLYFLVKALIHFPVPNLKIGYYPFEQIICSPLKWEIKYLQFAFCFHKKV